MSIKTFSLLCTTGLLIFSMPIAPVYGQETKHQRVPKSVKTQLDAYVKHYVSEYEANNCPAADKHPPAGEYKKARRLSFGDIDGNGVDDIAALYTITGLCGANSEWYYLAVFVRKKAEFKFAASAEVGAYGRRFVEFSAIKNRTVQLNTDEYLPDDPMCCPSGKGSTTYVLENGRLIEKDRIGQDPIDPTVRAWHQIKPLLDKMNKETEGEEQQKKRLTSNQ